MRGFGVPKMQTDGTDWINSERPFASRQFYESRFAKILSNERCITRTTGVLIVSGFTRAKRFEEHLRFV